MSQRRPFRETFRCAKAQKSVAVTGTDVVLLDGGGNVADIAAGNRTCSGMPTCGTLLGASDCPYVPSSSGHGDHGDRR